MTNNYFLWCMLMEQIRFLITKLMEEKTNLLIVIHLNNRYSIYTVTEEFFLFKKKVHFSLDTLVSENHVT